MDLSPLIPWCFVAIGLVLSLKAGSMTSGRKGCGGLLAMAMLACLLGVVMTVATVFTHDLCIGIHLCRSRGDGNMSYWFHSFFAIPLFWIAMALYGSGDDADPPSPAS
jgi:hypothetical protein